MILYTCILFYPLNRTGNDDCVIIQNLWEEVSDVLSNQRLYTAYEILMKSKKIATKYGRREIEEEVIKICNVHRIYIELHSIDRQ